MLAEAPIPVYSSLQDIYPPGALFRERPRWTNLVRKFEEQFGAQPTYVVRAPGRVNILGEHVDYSLFPVLPTAIEEDILIAIREIDELSVTVANLAGAYAPQTFAMEFGTEWDVKLDKDTMGWEGYVKAAVLGVLEAHFQSGGKPRGMQMLVTGNIPPGSGLSSSAAMVVASSLAGLTVNGLVESSTKGDLVNLAVRNEKRVGVNSGGMDQAASVLSQPGSLLQISFHPELSAERFPLPPSANLVLCITNSLAPHALASSAATQYNLRVVECFAGARLLSDAWNQKYTKERPTLMDVVELCAGDDLQVKLKNALNGASIVLGGDKAERGWTVEEMRDASSLPVGEFDRLYLEWLEVEATHFHLFKRVRHVLEESLRVIAFQATDGTPEALGKLARASHASCRDDYDCSCPELEELVQVCHDAGASGSRLTGAGWGGSVVSLVPESIAQEFLRTVKAKYSKYQGLSEEALEAAAFATVPGSGAGVVNLADFAM